MENPIKMDGLGVPLFLETPISALVRSYRSFSGARALLGHQLQGERHRFFATSEGLVLWDQLEWVSECKLQGIFNIFKSWQISVAPGVLFQAFRRGKAMRVMTFQCWCLGSSGPCWEVTKAHQKTTSIVSGLLTPPAFHLPTCQGARCPAVNWVESPLSSVPQ